LPHRHVGKNVLHQVRGPLGHPAAAATGTKTPPLARERHEAIQAARRAAEPREAAGQNATPEKGSKFLLDEPRQPVSIAQTGGLRAKRLEVIPHDLVQHGPGGRPRFVADGIPAWPTARHHRSDQPLRDDPHHLRLDPCAREHALMQRKHREQQDVVHGGRHVESQPCWRVPRDE